MAGLAAKDDLDNLFSASSPPPQSQSQPISHDPPFTSTFVDYNNVKDPQVMLTFYRRLFPWRLLFLWLNQSPHPNKSFINREFSFTLQNDAYLRYHSFANWEELKQEVLRLNPARFEIGPVYSAKPKDRRTIPKALFRPILRELVFDIDMTDYDGVRTCCNDKSICKRCWQFIAAAVVVLDASLREDFGFQHLLWVYSGRRGIHCWISDEKARALTDEQRKAIVGWLEVVKGGGQSDKKVNLTRPLHPSLKRSLELLKPTFAHTVLKDQNCFSTAEQTETLLNLLPADVALPLRQSFKSSTLSSIQKWKMISEKRKPNDPVLQDIILQYTYPRIDAEVSKHMNHLLKSPFVIHPATGNVCVPLDPSAISTFDPNACPKVGDLLRELEKIPPGEANPWEKTSVGKHVDYWTRVVEGAGRDALRVKQEEGKRSLDF